MLFTIVIGFSLGTLAAALSMPSWPAAAFVAALPPAALALPRVRGGRVSRAACIALLACASGMARTLLAPHELPPPFAPLIGTDAVLDGVIAADIDARETSQRVTVEAERSGARTRTLAVLPAYPTLAYGERVRVSGRLERPEPFDGGGRTFRYDRYLAKDGVFAVMERAQADVIGPRQGIVTRARGLLYDAKAAFIRALSRALPEPESGLAAGILAGGKQGLGKRLLAAFTAAGLVQIVVLSGYNVAVIADGVLRALSFLPKRAALSAAGGAILLFVIAAGSGAAALRAGLMACLALYAKGSGRSYDALRALAAAVLLMLLMNPLSLAFDPGFDLSLAATLGLILLAPRIGPRLGWIGNRSLRDIVATTLAAQAAVLPLLLYQTGNLSIASLPANVIVSFIVPPAMLASAVAGGIALGVPSVATVAGLPAYFLLLAIVQVAEWSAALPFAAFAVPAFPFALVIASYAVLAAWLAKRPPGARAGRA
jgi:competence protein ComEC